MKIVFIHNNKLHWITPYKSFDEIPEHPPTDLYVEAPPEAEEGWLFDRVTGEFFPPSEEMLSAEFFHQGDNLHDLSMIEAMQQMSKQNEELRQQNNKLEQRLQKLEEALSSR